MNERPFRTPRPVQRLRLDNRDRIRNTAILVGKNLPNPLRRWVIRHRMRQHERFDLKYGIDTQDRVQVSDLETSAPAASLANRYEGTPIIALRKIIRRLKVALPQFTFIDLGSGKGRVLLIASHFPFRSVIGVEFAKNLHDIAISNVKR